MFREKEQGDKENGKNKRTIKWKNWGAKDRR